MGLQGEKYPTKGNWCCILGAVHCCISKNVWNKTQVVISHILKPPPTPNWKKTIITSIRIIGWGHQFWKKKYRPITRKLQQKFLCACILLSLIYVNLKNSSVKEKTVCPHIKEMGGGVIICACTCKWPFEKYQTPIRKGQL